MKASKQNVVYTKTAFVKRKCKSRIIAASGKVSFTLILPKGERILMEF